MREGVPASVRALVRERVQALEQLEILLSLHGEPTRTWSTDELAESLQLGVVLVDTALRQLAQHGFVVCDAGRYHYAPREPQLQQAVDALARSYVEARPELLALIASGALGRVRRGMRQLRKRLTKN